MYTGSMKIVFGCSRPVVISIIENPANCRTDHQAEPHDRMRDLDAFLRAYDIVVLQASVARCRVFHMALDAWGMGDEVSRRNGSHTRHIPHVPEAVPTQLLHVLRQEGPSFLARLCRESFGISVLHRPIYGQGKRPRETATRRYRNEDGGTSRTGGRGEESI